jgi:isopentenyl diphosphate isomerase/L-lactate dehydrogenase-like FMN-dependent dehydrogenase
VLHPLDAIKLKQAGCAGIIVSNHGGRTLDGAPASLDALPAVRAALGTTFPVLFDGGVRSGSDVFKALALGADGVLIGRLQMYALGVAGSLGVAHMITLLREELEVCMALAGCATVQEINAAALEHKAPLVRDVTKEIQPC